MKLFHLIVANLRRHFLRTTLTVLSVAVAFILFSYLSAVRKGFEMGVEVAGQDRLIVRHKVTLTMLLPASYERDIEKIEGVVEATPFSWFNGIYQEARNFFPTVATDHEEFRTIYPEYLISDEELEAWKSARNSAIVGRVTAERFGFEVGDRVPLKATIYQPKDGSGVWEFDVAGIYEPATQGTDGSNFFFRQDFLEENSRIGEGMVGWYVIRIDDPDRASAISEEIDQTFANSSTETKSEAEQAFIQGFAKQTGNVGAIAVGITSIAFLTILLVAGNTMAQAVRERISELGVLKAVGFSDSSILRYVLTESLVISLMGGGVGLMIGWWLVAQGDPTGGAFPIFYFPISDLLVGVALVFLLGIGSGLFPAVQAMRLEPVEALRR